MVQVFTIFIFIDVRNFECLFLFIIYCLASL